MLHIKCPYCGMRSQNEFSYGGDATVKRPELNKEVSDQDWDNFVYNRKSPRGKHWELWQHISGLIYVAIVPNVFLLDFFYYRQSYPNLDQILLC